MLVHEVQRMYLYKVQEEVSSADVETAVDYPDLVTVINECV